jgi:large subunit ribosomal protein L41e
LKTKKIDGEVVGVYPLKDQIVMLVIWILRKLYKQLPLSLWKMKRSSRRWKKKRQMRWKWQRKRMKKEKRKRAARSS